MQRLHCICFPNLMCLTACSTCLRGPQHACLRRPCYAAPCMMPTWSYGPMLLVSLTLPRTTTLMPKVLRRSLLMVGGAPITTSSTYLQATVCLMYQGCVHEGSNVCTCSPNTRQYMHCCERSRIAFGYACYLQLRWRASYSWGSCNVCNLC